MKHIYLFTLLTIFSLPLFAQETVTFSGYNGSGSILSVNATSNVNQTITIVFEDTDIIQNFYTQFQNSIFMYGGLDTDAGGFQGAPDFNDLSNQPELVLIDADNNAQPNTYSITINLAQHYASVPNGTTVYGLNLLFQNQFGGGGNNQTLDLYIDLADAPKDDTLSVSEVLDSNTVSYFNNTLTLNNFQGPTVISVYDVSGKRVKKINTLSDMQRQTINLELPNPGLYIVTVASEFSTQTLKIISR
ncbi:T9SS type A sorting domain-containing protein [uncultured Psychroserpens sp.]|uniref:T9SS type A sorting domain-containing protein n=1 Tax=uncultured Psychroserpens sp. TaxID=255436 RepID=UPI002629E488|nr:T9SS type A sorting domain-containing protein [uncultured Psychroserpens sp.]